ncbi:hypothetical protein [Pedobacter panaciterrae]
MVPKNKEELIDEIKRCYFSLKSDLANFTPEQAVEKGDGGAFKRNYDEY